MDPVAPDPSTSPTAIDTKPDVARMFLKLPRPPGHPYGPGSTEIEMDTQTGKVPILPVIMLVGGYNSKAAKKQLSIILNNPMSGSFWDDIGEPMRVNSKGHACKCATRSMVQKLLMYLPSSRFSTEYVDEYMRVMLMHDVGDRAFPGGGACRQCGYHETCAILERELSGCDEMEILALKRKAEVISDLACIAAQKEEIRDKLRKFVR
jgi:hypothetical protein